MNYCCSVDQGSLCPINQLFCLSRQALHRPPPAPMKEHRLSPMREEQLSAPVNEEGPQNMGTGAAGGCPPGTVGSGSNKKPRSRTKVSNIILLYLFRIISRTDRLIMMHFGTWLCCFLHHILYQCIHPESWLCVFSRFPWRPWVSCRASSRMLDCTQTRRPSTPCQHSSTCPNTRS